MVLLGNGNCEAEFNCEAFNFDEGDCEESNTFCEEKDCFNVNCVDLVQNYVGDGSCDAQLNCAKFDFDNGDCDTCMQYSAPSRGACRLNADSTGFETVIEVHFGDKCLDENIISETTFQGVVGYAPDGSPMPTLVDFDLCISSKLLDPDGPENFITIECAQGQSGEFVKKTYMDGSCAGQMLGMETYGGFGDCVTREDCSLLETPTDLVDTWSDSLHEVMSISTCSATTGMHTSFYYDPNFDPKTSSFMPCDSDSKLEFSAERHESFMLRNLIDDSSDTAATAECTPLPERTNQTDFFFTGDYSGAAETCASLPVKSSCEKSGCCAWNAGVCEAVTGGICQTAFAKVHCIGGYSR
jgi:hypothetical protein